MEDMLFLCFCDQLTLLPCRVQQVASSKVHTGALPDTAHHAAHTLTSSDGVRLELPTAYVGDAQLLQGLQFVAEQGSSASSVMALKHVVEALGGSMLDGSQADGSSVIHLVEAAEEADSCSLAVPALLVSKYMWHGGLLGDQVAWRSQGFGVKHTPYICTRHQASLQPESARDEATAYQLFKLWLQFHVSRLCNTSALFHATPQSC